MNEENEHTEAQLTECQITFISHMMNVKFWIAILFPTAMGNVYWKFCFEKDRSETVESKNIFNVPAVS
jgi:hypothetical protein